MLVAIERMVDLCKAHATRFWLTTSCGPPNLKKTERVIYGEVGMKTHLKAIRTRKMITKGELAKSAGLSIPTIERIEKGYDCRLKTKRKLLCALGVSIENRHEVFPDDEE
jgi:DNA-binding XRE family transcriptional regulator